MEDLIIAAVHDYNWAQLKPFAVSLAQTGFKGEKVLLIENIPGDARENLAALGFKLIDTVFEKGGPRHFYYKKRFVPVCDYLRPRLNNFRYVIWVDARDLIFQTDPSAWLDNHATAPCIVAANMGGWPIKAGPGEDREARLLGPDIHSWLREYASCCSGTIAGDPMNMVYLMSAIATHPDPNLWDETYFNYLIRTSPLREVTTIPKPEDAWTATVSWIVAEEWEEPANKAYRLAQCTDKLPVFDAASGLVRAPETGVPFAIVHQYDRSGLWRDVVANKYR
jgi:hypothetical protein